MPSKVMERAEESLDFGRTIATMELEQKQLVERAKVNESMFYKAQAELGKLKIKCVELGRKVQAEKRHAAFAQDELLKVQQELQKLSPF